MDWFRSHHGAPTDPKWQLIARRAGAPTCAVVALFWQLLDYASQQSDRGSVAGFDIEVAALYLGIDDDIAEGILSALRDKGLIAQDRLANWDKRQPRREREDTSTSTNRVRDHRARKSSAPSTEPLVSPSNLGVTENTQPCNTMQHHETPCSAEKHLDKTRLDKTRLDKNTDDRQTTTAQEELRSFGASPGRSSSLESVKSQVSELKGLAYVQGVIAALPSWQAHLTRAFTTANERSLAEKGKPIANPLRWKCQVLANWLDGDGTPEDEPEQAPAALKQALVSPLVGDPLYEQWKANRSKPSPKRKATVETENPEVSLTVQASEVTPTVRTEVTA